jgi:hypothetical protein
MGSNSHKSKRLSFNCVPKGGIAKLTTLLAEMGASIKDIYHERAWLHTSVDRVQVKCVVELNGWEHSERLKKALTDAGYPTVWKPTKGLGSRKYL